MNKIISKEQFSEKVFKLEVEAPLIAKSRKAGHFVIVRVGEKGERMPLTIAGADPEKGTINPYSLSKTVQRLNWPDIYRQLATMTNKQAAFSESLPPACPEFASLSTCGQQLTQALHRWEALLNYAPSIIRP